MPLAPASAVGVPKILGQEGTGILARGWHFPGIILVFCWHAPSAILVTCLHEGGAGGAARCGHVHGHGGFPCWYCRLRSYVSKVAARGYMVEVVPHAVRLWRVHSRYAARGVGPRRVRLPAAAQSLSGA